MGNTCETTLWEMRKKRNENKSEEIQIHPITRWYNRRTSERANEWYKNGRMLLINADTCIVTQLSVATIHIQIIIIEYYTLYAHFLFLLHPNPILILSIECATKANKLCINGYSDEIVNVKNPKTEPVPLYFHLFG